MMYWLRFVWVEIVILFVYFVYKVVFICFIEKSMDIYFDE